MAEINIAYEIERILLFAARKNMLDKWDVIPAKNALLDLFKVEAPYEGEVVDSGDDTPVKILANMLDYAAENKLIEENTITYRDLFDSRIMGLLMPRASEVNKRFYDKLNSGNAVGATEEFYEMSKACNYIMTERIAKNHHWYSSTDYGNMEITVNLSKPEKDPKAIAAAKKMKQSSYPKCLLCVDNAGYAGRVNHPGRLNHKIIPITISGEQWCFQYSPYVYYNEHCIVFKAEHVPMKISEVTFRRLIDFVDLIPHYFVGSNADLPIVGGSILTHDHFQGGNHEFPMAKSQIEKEYSFSKYPNVKIGRVKWPMSVIRINGPDKKEIIELTNHFYRKWEAYSDMSNEIHAFTGETPHNTITPIARRRGANYEMDIVLRNNRTSVEHPDGIFHPHADLHHIKKENIGLIEVMGLAVLPGRLDIELAEIVKILSGTKKFVREEAEKDEDINKHVIWIEKLIEANGIENTKEKAVEVVRQEVGRKFATVLEDAGVFKRNERGLEGFDLFLSTALQ